MDCSPPGSSVHGIFQVRTLELVAISSSPSWPRDWTQVSLQLDSLPLSHLGSPLLNWMNLYHTINTLHLSTRSESKEKSRTQKRQCPRWERAGPSWIQFLERYQGWGYQAHDPVFSGFSSRCLVDYETILLLLVSPGCFGSSTVTWLKGTPGPVLEFIPSPLQQ